MRTIALAVTLAVLASPVASADPVQQSLAELRAIAGSKLSHVAATGQPSLRLVTGRLTVAPADDLRAAGAAFLARHGAALGVVPGTSLDFDRTVPLNTGAVLRYRQHIAGLPVLHGEVALRFDTDGILRIVSSGLEPFTRIDEPVPRMGSAAALARALDQPDVIAPFDPDAVWLGLVYFPIGGEARLAWQVETGAVPALLANWVTWVDARTGEVLAKQNRIWFDRLARIWEQNPVVTPDLSEVTLVDLPAWAADPYNLTGELVLARNCVDQHELLPLSYGTMTINVHICSEVQVAVGDASHDFLYSDNTDTAPEDLFAEPAMFYHANKVYDFFQGLGFTHLTEMPLRASVNFRIPIDTAGGFDLTNMTNAYGTLYPFDNAMFIPEGDMAGIFPRDSDSIVFGQGTHSDFSYDGDIIYHEFTHAVIGSTIFLAAATIDDQGLDIGPGALNEGYADVFAMFLTGNPGMGEYGGRWLTATGLIRDLDNDNVCPDDMIGEVHEDSLPWSGAAWSLYDVYGEALVQPYFDAMMALGPTSDFASAVRATVAEIRDRLDATTADAAQAELDRRNLTSCLRAIEAGDPFPQLMGEGTGTVNLTPYVPGYAMFHITLPVGQRQVRLHFDAQGGGFTGGTIGPYVLFRKGPDRLSFTYRGLTVTGNQDHEVAATKLTGNGYEAVYCEAGALDPGDFWVMIANNGSASMTMSAIDLTYNNSEPEGPCVGDDPDAGDGETDVVEDVPAEADTAGDAAEATDTPPAACEAAACDESCRDIGQAGGECVGEEGEQYCSCRSGSDGCGCRTTGRAGGLAGLLGLLAALVLLRRRPT